VLVILFQPKYPDWEPELGGIVSLLSEVSPADTYRLPYNSVLEFRQFQNCPYMDG
jgi:hypothetical protein